MKLVLIVELVACWFLFVELVACWYLFLKLLACLFFSLWNIYIDFSPCETSFLYRICCVLIFVRGIFCKMVLYVKIDKCWLFSSWNFCNDFSHREHGFVQRTSCVLIFVRKPCWILIFLLVKLILFMEHVACLFYSWNLLHADFCSWNLLYVDFSLLKTCTLIFLPLRLIPPMELVPCCFVHEIC